MIKGILFDLDTCLSAADETGLRFYNTAFDAIRRANNGLLDEKKLETAFSDCWTHSLDFVAEKHRFSEAMLRAGWKAFSSMEVREPMHGYPDLGVLEQLPLMKFLVTSGFRRAKSCR